jgi:GTP cyclohydrolase II
VFSPTSIELLDRARNDLRIGLPICIIDNDQSWLIFAIETISKERFSLLNENAEFSITKRRAKTLKTTAYDKNIGRFELDINKDWRWVKAIADPADDLNYPMKGPFVPIRVGSPNVHQIGIKLCKQARLLPAVLAQKIEKVDNLPLKASKSSKLHVFRHKNGTEENYAIEIGSPNRSLPVLCRIHSACFTGDLLGSLKCDCGAQLNRALEQMGEEQSGVLLYLNQEGRGIGLTNKMRAYALQNQGFDTVEANHRLGFEDEERDFEIAANILKNLGFNSTRLLTNNPNKIKMMNSSGIKVVERVSLNVGKTAENADYLATKVKKSGHFS